MNYFDKSLKLRLKKNARKRSVSLLMSMLIGSTTTSFAQISIKAKDQTVQQIMKDIEKKSTYKFFYNSNFHVLNKKASIDINDGSITSVLNKLFENSGVSWEFKNNLIVLTPTKQKTAEKKLADNQKTKKVTGIVTDTSGEPVIGANVIIDGTTNGTVTDIDGNFSIEVPENVTLKVSYIGLSDQLVSVSGKNYLDIKMKDNSKALEEVVVVGYGTNTKSTLISSVSTVSASKLENVPASNMTQTLAGRAPGLIVKANGGGVNSQSTISIRGGSTPLVVIDGVIRSYNDFVTLAPEEIESLSILKDASATAVYGSRAANGILQVVTKRGKSGALPKVEYSFNQSYSEPTIFPKKLDSYNRAFYKNAAAKNDGIAMPFTEEDLELYKNGQDPYGHPNVDWEKIVLRNFAPQQKHNIKLYGGSDVNKFFISLGYLDQGSLYRTDTYNMDRTNFRINQITTIKNIGLQVTSQLDGYIQKDQHPYTSSANGPGTIFLEIQDRDPWDLAYNNLGLPYTTTYNPVSDTSKDAGYIRNKNNVVNGLISLDWELPWLKDLHLRGTGNYRYYSSNGKQWRKDPAQYTWDSEEPQYSALSQLTKSMSDGYSYTLQFFADYTKQINKHSISALAGYEATYGFSQSLWGSRDSYQFDIDQVEAGPVSTMKNGGSESESGRAGFVGQVKYNYDSRYMVEGSIRLDGSDNFPKHKRWGTFFSGSLGWSIANEAFFETLKERDIFNTFKLRASYGEVGLDNWGDPYSIGRFAYLPSYSYKGQAYVINNILQPGFSEGAMPSRDLTWFTTKQVDIGFDFSSLNNKIYGSFDYYYYQTSGFLYQPDQLLIGYVEPLGIALPKVSTDGQHRRAGWEFQLGYQNSIGDLRYDVSANLTLFDQLWARNPNESLENKKNPYKRTTQQKGYWGVGYENLGYYLNEQDIYNSVKRLNSSNLAAGDIKYNDFNGDGVIDGQDQIRIGKNSFPRGNYGINLGFNYKGFTLNMLFQGATRFDMELGATTKMNSAQTGTTPVYKYHLDYWTPDNTNAKFPRLTSTSSINGGNNYPTSDFWLVNGAYFRFKDVQLMYDFKHSILKKVNWISSLNVFFSGQNIFTISEAMKYGLDPENASTNNYAYPLERTLAFGFNIGF